MIPAVLLFITISVISWSLSKLTRKLLAHRKTSQYFQKISQLSSTKNSLSQSGKLLNRSEEKLKKTRLGKHFQKLQDQYDLAEEVKLTQVFIVLGGTLLLCWNLSRLLHTSPFPMIMFALAIEGVVIFVILRKRRLANQLDVEFPKILESMAGVYQINPDLKQSFQMTEVAVQSKVATKFLSDLNQVANVGVPIIEALEMTARKWVYQPLFFFISAVKLHQSSGGNLSELFHHTAQSIRRQQQNKKAMDAVMFQNKVSAFIVCSLVPVILLFTVMMSKNYRTVITSQSTARALVLGAIIWWMIGVVVMWRTLRVRV